MAASVLTGVYPVTLAHVQLDNTYASLGNSTITSPMNFENPGATLGDVCIDNKGGQWIFVKAAENITRYSLCHITNASIIAGTYLAEMTEASDIATGPKILGLCLNTITAASNPYFWLFRGPGGGLNTGIKVRSVGFTAGALAYPDASNAGAVDDDNVDESVIAGLTTLTTTTTEEAVEVFVSTIMTCNLGETD